MIWKRFYTIGADFFRRLKTRKFAAGMSLLEILVAVSFFVVIILAATSIFSLVIKQQRSAISSQNVQESLKYFLEIMSKEIRTAEKDDTIFAA